MIVMAASKQNRNKSPDVPITDPCQPEKALKHVFGLGRRNAPGVPFSIRGFREFCRAGVICGYSDRLDHRGCLWRAFCGQVRKGNFYGFMFTFS